MMQLRLFVLFTLVAVLAHSVAPESQQRVASEPLAWQAASGPYSGVVTAFEQADSGTIFALANRDLFRSTDDGITWQRCESQPPRNAGNPTNPWLLAIPIGRRLFASGQYNGPIYQTQDECVSSQMIAPPPGAQGSPERLIFANGGLVTIFNGPSVFTSSDFGYSWTRLSAPSGIEPKLASRDGAAFLIVSQHLFRSTDRGGTWTPVPADGMLFSSLVTGGQSLYAGAWDKSGQVRGLWRSVDGGATWVHVLESGFTAIGVRGTRIFVATMNPPAVARSTDDGNTWTRLPNPVASRGINQLFETRQGTLVAGSFSGIYRSTDAGESWTPTGISGLGVSSFVAERGRAYASGADGTLWKSENAGLAWSRLDTSFAGGPRQFGWPATFSRLVMGEGQSLHGTTDRDLLASIDGGSTWTASGLNVGVNALTRVGNTWFAGTWSGVFRSSDLTHWSECSAGLTLGSIQALTATPEGDLIALDSLAPFRSTDGCRSWWPIGRLPLRPSGGSPRGWPILTSDSTLGVATLGDSITQLSVPDRNWVVKVPQAQVSAFVKDDNGRYWIGTRNGVSQLIVDGPEWRLTPVGLEGRVSALAYAPEGYLLASIENRGILRARLP